MSEQTGRCACDRGHACSSHLELLPAEIKSFELLKVCFVNCKEQPHTAISSHQVEAHTAMLMSQRARTRSYTERNK